MFKISVSQSNPCFIISAKPLMYSLSGSESNKSIHIRTSAAGAKVPIIFLNLRKSMPVFPPNAASAIARRVVGIRIISAPRI